MKQRPTEESLMYPPLEELLERIPLKFELVLAATRRAKQIIRQQRLNPNAPENDLKGRKPLSVALEDILEQRIDTVALLAEDIEYDVVEDEELDMFPDLPYPDRERDQEEGFVAEDGAEASDDDSDDSTGVSGIDTTELNWEINDD